MRHSSSAVLPGCAAALRLLIEVEIWLTNLLANYDDLKEGIKMSIKRHYDILII